MQELVQGLTLQQGIPLLSPPIQSVSQQKKENCCCYKHESCWLQPDTVSVFAPAHRKTLININKSRNKTTTWLILHPQTVCVYIINSSLGSCACSQLWDKSCSLLVFILNWIFLLKRFERRNYGLDFRATHVFVGANSREKNGWVTHSAVVQCSLLESCIHPDWSFWACYQACKEVFVLCLTCRLELRIYS